MTTSTSHKTEKQEHSRSNSPAIPDEHSSNYVRGGLELIQSTSTESVPQNDNNELVGNNVKPSRAGVEGINEMNSTLMELFSKYEDNDVLAGLQ